MIYIDIDISIDRQMEGVEIDRYRGKEIERRYLYRQLIDSLIKLQIDRQIDRQIIE